MQNVTVQEHVPFEFYDFVYGILRMGGGTGDSWKWISGYGRKYTFRHQEMARVALHRLVTFGKEWRYTSVDSLALRVTDCITDEASGHIMMFEIADRDTGTVSKFSVYEDSDLLVPCGREGADLETVVFLSEEKNAKRQKK